MLEWFAYYLRASNVQSNEFIIYGNGYNAQTSYRCNYNYSAPYWSQNSQRNVVKGRRVNNNIKQVQQSTTNRKAIEDANFKKGLETKIEEGNRGYELLKKMGYQEGQGLGKDASGILQPLTLEVKNDRKGLGAEKKPPMPVAEKKTVEPAPLTKNQRKSIRRRANKAAKAQMVAKAESSAGKQSVVIEKTQTVAKPIQTKSQTVKDTVTKAENKTSAAKVENVVAKTHEVTKQQINSESTSVAETVNKNIRRKHSPIRSPDYSEPQPVKTHRLSVGKQLDFSPPKALMSSINSFDPKSLLKKFNSEIELMQLRLEAAASRNPLHGDDDLIVVKICIGNDHIANHAFEFIRTELVGWIGVYQDQGNGTPIFHSMTNNECHITVVCDNAYAYKCLEHCIDDIAQMKTMGMVKLIRMPPISSLIYCVDAVYEGIARDADLFRKQIQMHKPKLHVDQWIIVSHEVCALERKTYFMFLIDERSVLALDFQYTSSFCICMHKLVIRNLGVVAEEYLN